MKKSIIIEVLLALGIILLMYPWIIYIESLSLYIRANEFNEDGFKVCLTIFLLITITIIAIMISMGLVAIKDFPCFKPLADKLQARKEKRTQAKAERADAGKQARIAQLQAELEELKKDE